MLLASIPQRPLGDAFQMTTWNTEEATPAYDYCSMAGGLA